MTADTLTQKKNRDRYRESSSPWVAGFSCAHLKILIVCRGPIRMEAMDVFRSLGADYGILLSEKDSVAYPYTLAPELRVMRPDRVHRVPDYMGVGHEEKQQRIREIVNIARKHKYTHIFAGYGFMSEDGGFVHAIEDAGLGFIGPASNVHFQAGAKDMAKVIAREAGVSVTPGLDNITAVTLLQKAGGDLDSLKNLAGEHGLSVESTSTDPEEYAEAVLQAGYAKGIGLVSVEDLQAEATAQCEQLFKDNPGKRLRLKYIGGGGGKGQRIVTKTEEVKNAVSEVLSESKATGDADNKNFLIELNIEGTRHNEIQMLGNGEWAIALGGRDCSLQMHEQKLVELSITEELYEYEIAQATKEGHVKFAEVLKGDLRTLKRMEEQAERFGTAVKLNSASTFECIVSDQDFYFMEMNTRIQVEHRVTEMVYSLKFSNPSDPGDSFVVESLVEAMALVAAHGTRLPKPERTPRYRAGGEVRLNATNDALQPHAGGVIESWTAPVDNELRDDQGIGFRNPDTGWFIKYHLAGAYDSNVALVVSHGKGRRQNLDRLSDILRRMEIRGPEVNTNLYFHYGILNFCLGLHPMLKPDTKFVVPYLAAVGSLAKELESFDFDTAWSEIQKQILSQYGPAGVETLGIKRTLLSRPIDLLFEHPHVLAGWLVRNHRRAFEIQGGRVHWKRNPLRILNDLYHFCHLEEREDAAPAQRIWPDDNELLQKGLTFYKDLESHLGVDTEKEYEISLHIAGENASQVYDDFNRRLLGDSNGFAGVQGFNNLDDDMFRKCAAAHRGWQSGMTVLDLLVMMGERSGLLGFGVSDSLEPTIPSQFLDADKQEDYLRYLAPPPAASADTLVAVSGGMFYARESPASPPYLEVGTHFEAGDPIYIIEVMKMFNKVHAEFSGTVEEVLLGGQDGVVVKKGEPLFKVKPDVEIKIETEDERNERRRKSTLELMKGVIV